MELNYNAMNQVTKGTVILSEHDPVSAVCLVVKGRITCINNGVRTVVGTGSFLGICDLHHEFYQVSYEAFDDAVIYPFAASGSETISKIMGVNKDYGALMVISLNRYIKELGKIYLSLAQEAEAFSSFLSISYAKYGEIVQKNGFPMTRIDVLEEMEPFAMPEGVKRENVDYFSACCDLPLDVQKAYYKPPAITVFHINSEVELVSQLISGCMELSLYIYETFAGLMDVGENCLFKALMKLAFQLKDKSMQAEIGKIIDGAVDQINQIENIITEKTGIDINVEREYMEKAYYQLISGETPMGGDADLALNDSENYDEEVLDIFDNSLEKILDFSGVETELREDFVAELEEYKALSDKTSTEDKARNMRRKITKLYYRIYTKVFFKACETNDNSKIIDLFLNFGYMDEKLLNKEQLLELYYLNSRDEQQGSCRVYSMREWLEAIYKGEKEPSKSEMDMDYSEYLRERKKNKEITEAEMKELEKNCTEKVLYEINNMLTYNNRIISGQATIFLPVLHQESFIGSVRRAKLDALHINAAVNKVVQIDYSAFYRQTLYTNPEKGIEKEYIMIETYPDIVLLPTYGTNGIMWQDITGKRRTTPGRFLLPAFCDTNLDDMMIRLVGRFRWELCRTIQGIQWNDIKTKSLTSEYMDYLQFYRKNHDLSEEKKEKLKVQIQKARGASREVFVVDYVAWIKFEAQGSIRLNKVVRDILATYCPFKKELREKVGEQPLFAASMVRFNREHVKTMKEISLRKRALEKAGVELPAELAKTYEFYEKY